ncbi:MAG: Hsp20/alpha crystallin family protein [Candidatus Aminicenantes bacterium]|jgi:HSP20 family protein
MSKKIRPVSRIVKIEAEINKIAGEVFLKKNDLLGLDQSWVPCVDVTENEIYITVDVELPGVEQKDIQLLFYGNRIEIKGQKKETLIEKRIKYLRLEREHGPFRRFIFLPNAVIPAKTRASLENGVLTIQFKKVRRKQDREVVLKIRKQEDKTEE